MMNRLVASSNSRPTEISSWSNAATSFQLLEKSLDLVWQGQLRLSAGASITLTVQRLLQLGPLLLLDLGRANDDVGGRLHTSHIDRLCIEAPRQRSRFGRFIDRLSILGRRGRSRTVYEMDLNTVFGAIGVVSNQSTVAETKLLSSLLRSHNTLSDFGHTITLVEFLRRVKCLDRTLEGLGRDDVGIHPVIGVLLVGLGALRALRNLGQTRPGNPILILTAFAHDIKYATVYTNTIQSLGVLVPLQCTLGHQASFLSVQIYNIMVDVVADIMPGEICTRQTCYFLRQVAVGVLVHDNDLIPSVDQVCYIVGPYRADVLLVIHDTWIGHLNIGRGLEVYLIRSEYTFQLTMKIKPAAHCTPSQSSTQALGIRALRRILSISPPPMLHT
nr:MAG TPA: hypothetical protein [Caudoviricetes sp.]